MFDLQPSKPRKRRFSNLDTPSATDTAPDTPKKHKGNYSYPPRPPPQFWDNLSQIHLTKSALRELNHRNAYLLQSALPTSAGLSFKQHPRTRRKSSLLFAGQHKPSDDLKRFARLGGPDLSHMRGYSCLIDIVDPMSQSRSRSRRRALTSTTSSQNISETTNTTSTKSTGPYSRNFQQNLIDYGVYPHAYKYPDGRVPAKPENWEEINERLRQPRPSLSPSRFTEEDYAKFVQADADAVKEKQVSTSVIPIIEGDVGDAKCVSGGIPFTNFDHLTDGTLAPGNPDVYYGARPEQLDRQVRGELNGVIIPSTQDDLPILPNFVLAAKGPDGSLAVAGRQACYDGALGARSMHALQSYGKEAVTFDNKAYTITSIYHGGQLKTFTCHPYQDKIADNKPEYCIHQLNTWGMTGNLETFIQGTTAYRNARDWTKEQRALAITQANTRAKQTPDQKQTLSLMDGGSVQYMEQELISSFASDASTVEPHFEILSQDVQRSEDSGTTIGAVEAPSEELATGRAVGFKRANRLSREVGNPQPKRRNASSTTSVHTMEKPKPS